MSNLSKTITDKLDPNLDGEGFNLTPEEVDVKDYLIKRVEILKSTKNNILDGINYQEIMKSADVEYAPKLYTQGKNKGTSVFIQDELTGLRGSRLVSGLSDNANWKSDVKATTLYVKIQTALSILVGQNPEATFKPGLEKYKKNSAIAKAIWKRSWNLAGSKEALKLLIFDIAKYGWGIGVTKPRIIKREKQVLEELDLENPDKNVYRKDTIIEYNDIFRKRLDPYRTWIDDQTNLADPFSMKDWYYEEDFSKDEFDEEFGMYPNAKYASFGSPVTTDDESGVQVDTEKVQRDDMITVGFYEHKNKDLYCIYLPDQQIPLYKAPLPNDDGKLSCWWSYWTIRDPRTPYGIGLYEVIKNDKILYDRLSNMTVDQLVMAIYPMLFFSGPPIQGEGDITLAPNVIKQKLPGTSIDQVKIQYDQRGWEGVEKQKERMDDSSAITPLLEGQVEGKTLGETIHAKDSALKRLSSPLTNIAYTLEQEAYITLSWANQIYNVPEVKEFISIEELEKEIEARGTNPDELKSIEGGGAEASFFPQLDLGLEEDRDGTLIEAPEDRFMSTFDLDTKWEGTIVVKAMSIVSMSQELERQRKLELFNLVSPVVQTMSMLFYQQVDPKTGQAFTPEGGKETAIALYNPLKQILEIQDEKPENWIPKDILLVAENPELLKEQKIQEQQAQQEQEPLFVNGDEQVANEANGSPQGVQQPTIPENGGGAETVVPPNQVSNPLRASEAQVVKAR